MSASKILSYMFFIFLWLATCSPYTCRVQITAEVIQKIPVSSSGSAAVTERKYSRVPPSLVRFSTSCWGSFSAISCPIVALKSSMFLHFSRCTDYAFFFGVHCHVPCLCFILLSWPFCLLVFSASFLSFQFLLLLFSVLFSWLFITFLGVSWRCVACLGLPWLFLIFLGFAWRFCSLVFASLLAFLFVLFPGLLILIHDCAKHFARTRTRWST